MQLDCSRDSCCVVATTTNRARNALLYIATRYCAFSVFWPLLRRFPVPDYPAGAWVDSMEQTIPSYVGTAEECLFRADLDPLLPALQDCLTLLYGQQVSYGCP